MRARLIAWSFVFVFCAALFHWGGVVFRNPFSGLGVNPVARALPPLPAGCKSVKDCS